MTTTEYLEEVSRVIKDVFRPNDPSGSMPVATAAYLVKQRLRCNYTTFGFSKFKDVLAELERAGTIRTGRDGKDAFAFWIVDDRADPSCCPKNAIPSRPLRKPVWFAFVASHPSGRRFFERRTGEVRLGEERSPEGDWIEILPLDPDAERARAREFLQTNAPELEANVQPSLQSERWYVEVPKTLAESNPRLASRWKRWRSTQVAVYVEDWRTKHGIDVDLIYESPRSSRRTEQYEEASTGLRQILLSAIQKMTTQQLLELPIPARLVMGAARPDLLEG